MAVAVAAAATPGDGSKCDKPVISLAQPKGNNYINKEENVWKIAAKQIIELASMWCLWKVNRRQRFGTLTFLTSFCIKTIFKS